MMNKKDEIITYEEFMIMFKYAPRMCYTLYEKAEDEIEKLREQKDDVVEYIKNNTLYEEEYDYDYEENPYLSRISDEQSRINLLRMLGETDE